MRAHYTLKAACGYGMTVYVDDIRRVNNTAEVNVPISECFRTIEIRCTKTETSTNTGIIASVEDNDGNLLLKTDSNWACLLNGDSGGWTTAVTNNFRPSNPTSNEISTLAIPIWSEGSSKTAFCKRSGNFQREGKRFLRVARKIPKESCFSHLLQRTHKLYSIRVKSSV